MRKKMGLLILNGIIDYDFLFIDDQVMAGAYMARNTEKARKFMTQWDILNDRKPPGFASADNGAIHLALYEATGVVVSVTDTMRLINLLFLIDTG